VSARTAIIIAVISGVLGGGGTAALINAITTRPERAQTIEFREYDRLVAEIARQDVRIVAQDARISNLREDVRELTTSLVVASREVIALKARIEELEAQLRARDEIIIGLREEIAELRTELGSLRP